MTTNHKEKLDPALLRPGKFYKLINDNLYKIYIFFFNLKINKFRKSWVFISYIDFFLFTEE